MVAKERLCGSHSTRLSFPELSKIFRNQQTRWFGDLIAFSGAVVRDSSILGKIISWEVNQRPHSSRTVNKILAGFLEGSLEMPLRSCPVAQEETCIEPL
jgi:hypothetical protein